MFNDGVKSYELVNRVGVLNHSHGRMVFGPFEKKITEVIFGEYPDR